MSSMCPCSYWCVPLCAHYNTSLQVIGGATQGVSRAGHPSTPPKFLRSGGNVPYQISSHPFHVHVHVVLTYGTIIEHMLSTVSMVTRLP